ncbi:MAG: serine/threonine-protein phosphatase [Leptospiraceae bacterium]|nr:serine/threonine-protein phosphatase [Leptospiraceae bacterium]MDW8306171.1 SpoIIE family protein phosphatase [Leptospiraceae bacterium]
MRPLAWLLPLFFLLGFAFFIYQDFEKFILEHPGLAVLQSPHGLNIHPLAFEYPNPTYYYTKRVIQQKSPLLTVEWLMAISPGISMTFLYLLTATFLFLFAKMRRLEKGYILFAIFISLYTLLYFDFLTYHRFTFFFYANLFLTNGAFLYLLRGIYGYGTRSYVLWTLVTPALLLVGFLYPRKSEDEILLFILASLSHILLFFYGLYFALVQLVRYRQRLPIGLHVLGFTALFTVLLPVLFLFGPIYVPLRINHSYNVAYFVPAIFTMLFFIMGVRFGITQFTVPVNSLFLRITYFLFFSLLYWFGIGFHIVKLPYFKEEKISYIIFSVALVLILDPLRTLFFTYFHRYFILRKITLDRYLIQASRYVSNPRRINEFLERLLDTLQEGLDISSVKLYFSSEIFQDWRIAEARIAFLPKDHPVWLQLRLWQRTTKKYLAFTQTTLGPIRDFLIKEGGYLLLSFARFPALVILSQRRTRQPFLTEDIKFLQKVLALSEPLMENYRYLIESLTLRRRERELDYSARIQKKVIPREHHLPGVEFASVFEPSEKVTGDIIDFLPMSRYSYILLLGDVSGHGLGSAYLMAFVRAFFRGGALVANMEINEILQSLNNFLVEQYRGHDFLTLFVAKITLSKEGAEVSYISAGHHPAIVFREGHENPIFLENSHRLIGVVHSTYVPQKILFKEPFRLYLYSDGAFEIFNQRGKILGQPKLLQWIKESQDLGLREQLEEVHRKIKEFSQNSKSAERDDLSLLALFVDPQKALA